MVYEYNALRRGRQVVLLEIEKQPPSIIYFYPPGVVCHMCEMQAETRRSSGGALKRIHSRVGRHSTPWLRRQRSRYAGQATFSLVTLQSGDLRPEEYANARARTGTGAGSPARAERMDATRGRGIATPGGMEKAGEHGELKQTLLLVVPRARHHPRFA